MTWEGGETGALVPHTELVGYFGRIRKENKSRAEVLGMKREEPCLIKSEGERLAVRLGGGCNKNISI